MMMVEFCKTTRSHSDIQERVRAQSYITESTSQIANLDRSSLGVAPFQPPPATTPTTRTNQTFALATSSVTREEIGDIPILDVLGETVEEDEEPERLLPWKGPMRKDKTAGDHLAQIQRKIRVRKDRLEENKAKLDSLSTMGEDYQDQMEQLVEEQEDLDLQLKDLELHLQRAFRDFKGHPDSYWHSDI